MQMIDEYIELNESILSELHYERVINSIHITIPITKKTIVIDEKKIKKLQNNELLQGIPDIHYYYNYGFSINNYGEFFLGTDEYSLYDIYGNVSEIDLKFNIGDAYIEFNSVSPLCRLLIEPYYSDKAEYIADRGLEEYFYTLKIYNAPQNTHKEIVVKALFYLNAHYLKKTKKPLTIFHLIPEGYDENDLSEETDDEIIISRKRVFKRKDIISIEPLYFYNDACIQTRDNQFLGFYKVLEFFFYRGMEKELESCRYDKAISEKEILSIIQNKDERSLLKNLLNNVLTKNEKKKLIDYLLNKDYLKDNNFDKFSNRIYDYRNSIVHAKENQISNTNLPDIFNEDEDYQVWNYLIKYIAEHCIKRLNCKKNT